MKKGTIKFTCNKCGYVWTVKASWRYLRCPDCGKVFIFRIAERYGMISVNEWNKKFYFETIK